MICKCNSVVVSNIGSNVGSGKAKYKKNGVYIFLQYSCLDKRP